MFIRFMTGKQKTYGRATGRQRWDYNKIYDLMHLVGVGIHQMRLCQPYGDDQRKGLWLFKMLEPETWSRVVGRVQGANFGNRYVELSGNVLGNIRIRLPGGAHMEELCRVSARHHASTPRRSTTERKSTPF